LVACFRGFCPGLELEYHLLFAHDAEEISTSDYESLLGQVKEVRKMLFGLIDQLEGQAS